MQQPQHLGLIAGSPKDAVLDRTNAVLAIQLLKEPLRIQGASHALVPETFERHQGLGRHVYDNADHRQGFYALHET